MGDTIALRPQPPRPPKRVRAAWKLGLPNLSPAEWESAERQRECNYAVTNNGFVRLLARDLLVGPWPSGRHAARSLALMAPPNPFVRPTLHPPGGKCGLVSAKASSLLDSV